LRRDLRKRGLCRQGLQRAIADGVIASRAELFICSKLWASDWAIARQACEKSIAALQCEYLDLYLVHTPVGVTPERDAAGKPVRAKIACHQIWASMEALVGAGLAKHIGVSNWSCLQLADLQAYCKIPCAANQIEIHPSYPNAELAQWCLSQGITPVAYCPLGSGKGDIDLPVVTGAGAPSAGQAILRWGLDKGYTVVTKSTDAGRMAANLDAGSSAWALSPAAAAAIDAVAGNTTDRKFKICDHSGEFGMPVYN
jgi:diketogulonate reductase-like aldo/keto reductase